METVTERDRNPERMSDGVYLANLASGERAAMKHWRVEPGETLPVHSHDHEQIGFVIRGELVALVEGGERVLEPGDSYVFPSNEEHGAVNRGDEPAVGIGVLSPPRTEPDWADTEREPTTAESDD